MEYNLKEILKQFSIDIAVSPYGNGHINDTYIAESDVRYILQRINTDIFKNPDTLMENIQNVTEHLRKKIRQNGGDENRETLTVIPTINGDRYLKTDSGCYRVYRFIENTVSYDNVENASQLYHAAKAFGKFQNMLADFPADKLYETIPDFHDTGKRFEALKQAIKEDAAGRAKTVAKEIEFALSHENEVNIVTDAIKSGEVPLRVTHNDTKLNNVLLDKDTGEGVCVIDLDTVMPGSMLYDYGDALRFGASSGTEDERDLSKIWFDLDLFEAFTRGYLEEVASVMTKKEIELLPFSAKLMTYECGIRFLTDYLNGDTYFKIHREHHNLDRARTQFKLVSDMESKTDSMKKIVEKYL